MLQIQKAKSEKRSGPDFRHFSEDFQRDYELRKQKEQEELRKYLGDYFDCE